MAQTALEMSSGSVYTTLVTFTWGDSHVARYCRWTGDVVSNGQTFSHEPTLQVKDLINRGGTDDTPPTVQMRLTRAPFSTLILPYAHAKVTVIVEEIVPGDDSTRRLLFTGKITRINAKPSGKPAVGLAKCAGIKARLKATASVQTLTTCFLPFGGSTCGFDLEATKLSVVLEELYVGGVANRVRLSTAGTPDLDPLKWDRGYFLFDGLAIVIRRSFDNMARWFDLREIPPPDWEGETVTLYRGCKKDLPACKFNGRESKFSGLGIVCPDKNPIYQI